MALYMTKEGLFNEGTYLFVQCPVARTALTTCVELLYFVFSLTSLFLKTKAHDEFTFATHHNLFKIYEIRWK